MRSETTKRILEETPQETKDRVRETTFKLIFNGDYIMGYDPYEENSKSSLGVISTPKKEWGIKKIRGFKRVVELGWTYNVKIVK